MRLLFLGDSCVQWGKPPYPQLVERHLNERRLESARPVESIMLASAGYTTHQGRVVAERHGAAVDPAIVVVQYGWNDHWLAYGSSDADWRSSRLDGALDALYRRSRVLQLGRSLLEGADADRTPAERQAQDLRRFLGSELRDIPRVSPDEFGRNLLEIARLFDRLEAALVFVTAPSSHRGLGVPRHLVQLRYATDADAVIDRHEEYAEIVRQVARASDASLLDLEAEMRDLPAERLRELFLIDGIHFTDAGREHVARRLIEHLTEEFEI